MTRAWARMSALVLAGTMTLAVLKGIDVLARIESARPALVATLPRVQVTAPAPQRQSTVALCDAGGPVPPPSGERCL